MRRIVIAGALALAAVAAAPGAASATPAAAGSAGGSQGCEERTNDTYAKLLHCVTTEGVLEHLQAFQSIADANNGTRASATPGYDASADYVAGLLEDAGYEVTRQQFQFPFFEETAPAVLQRTSPNPATFETGTYEYSGGGDVTGPVIPVDLNLGDLATSTSGCESADFAGLDWSGSNEVALIRRGTCTFGLKALNAQTAGPRPW